MNEPQDAHATVIAEDTAADQRQVEYEVGAADESTERMFDLLFKRLDEVDNMAANLRAGATTKREHIRAKHDEAKTYACSFLERLGAVNLLMAKIGDGIDGIPEGKPNGHA